MRGRGWDVYRPMLSVCSVVKSALGMRDYQETRCTSVALTMLYPHVPDHCAGLVVGPRPCSPLLVPASKIRYGHRLFCLATRRGHPQAPQREHWQRLYIWLLASGRPVKQSHGLGTEPSLLCRGCCRTELSA